MQRGQNLIHYFKSVCRLIQYELFFDIVQFEQYSSDFCRVVNLNILRSCDSFEKFAYSFYKGLESGWTIISAVVEGLEVASD